VTWWLDVLAVGALLMLGFVVFAYGYRIWRMYRHNDEGVAGGSMGDQMLAPLDKPAATKPNHS
jgi:hypothetical protein